MVVVPHLVVADSDRQCHALHRGRDPFLGGEVIVGDIGFRGHTIFTALGDSVNVAARLQDMTKSLDCRVIVSEEVGKTAGIAVDALPRQRVEIRGRVEPMTVFAVNDPTVLTGLLDPQTEPAEAESEVTTAA
jgi:adenylate cyclase